MADTDPGMPIPTKPGITLQHATHYESQTKSCPICASIYDI